MLQTAYCDKLGKDALENYNIDVNDIILMERIGNIYEKLFKNMKKFNNGKININMCIDEAERPERLKIQEAKQKAREEQDELDFYREMAEPDE